jgi:hypothetical protein
MGRAPKRVMAIIRDQAVIFRATELFMTGIGAPKTATAINKECNLTGDAALSRQQVYALVRKAISARMLELHPPRHDEFRIRLARRFGINDGAPARFGKKEIIVVHAGGPGGDRNVAHVAARVALNRAIEIRDSQREKSPNEKAIAAAARGRKRQASTAIPVDPKRLERHAFTEQDVITMGLGPGQATLDFVRHFAACCNRKSIHHCFVSCRSPPGASRRDRNLPLPACSICCLTTASWSSSACSRRIL